MEKPSWVYCNKTHFNHFIDKDGVMQVYFLAFEHNWDIFQFLPTKHKYYFYLNDDYKSEYNFTVLYRTFLQKCKHLRQEHICFILKNEYQEQLLKQLPLSFNYIMKETCIATFTEYSITDEFFDNFALYPLSSAIETLNTVAPIDISDATLNDLVSKYYIQRSTFTPIESVSFFGASVTMQNCGYTSFIDVSSSKIYTKGYEGCTVQHAMWLVDHIIRIKPTVCVLEWLSSAYNQGRREFHAHLDIVVQKLLQNNIVPIFLYLYKKDICEFKEQKQFYEELASYYSINSIHIDDMIVDSAINPVLIVKDNVHTTFTGSKLYGKILSTILNKNCEPSSLARLLQDKKEPFVSNNPNINTCVIPLDISGSETRQFDNKTYYKITDRYVLQSMAGCNKLYAVNILFCNTNGVIYINNQIYQTWDKNCFYTRNGYIIINMDITHDIHIQVSQDIVDTSECKYEAVFPDEKCLWIAELVIQ